MLSRYSSHCYVNDKIVECILSQVIGDVNREDSIRQMALETIVTTAESMPGPTRKQKTLIPLISECLKRCGFGPWYLSLLKLMFV